MPQARGRLVILSGPSGTGKTTVVRRLLERASVPLVLSVSATTRKPRTGETEGTDYYFLSEQEFQTRRRRGEFLECFQVHGDHWYGTLRSEVADRLAAGKWVLLEIDVQGALAVLREYPDSVTIFLRTPSLQEYERRLRTRGTEDETAIQRRLEGARRELEQAGRYRYQVTNDEVDRAADEICDILSREAHSHAG